MGIEFDSAVFQTRLKETRKKRKLTQQQLADLTEIPVTSIAHFEAGGRKPSLENFYKLLIILNISADYLLGRADTQHQSIEDPITNALKDLPEAERRLIEKFIISLQKG